MQTLEGQWGWEDNGTLGIESLGLSAGRGYPPGWWWSLVGMVQLHLGISMKPGGGP